MTAEPAGGTPPAIRMPTSWTDALRGKSAMPGDLIGTYGAEAINGTYGEPSVARDCPVKTWGIFLCGHCTGPFHASPLTVPAFDGRVCCLNCWEMRAQMRAAASMPAEGRPPAFPEDYPPQRQ